VFREASRGKAFGCGKRARRTAVALILGTSTVGLAACGGHRPAPPAAALPVASGARVIASKVGGSTVDTASNPDQYRYEAARGSRTMSRTDLLVSEVTALTNAGWRDVQSFVVDSCNGAVLVRGISPRTPDANVLINSPRHSVYVALSTTMNKRDADQQTDGSPLFGDAAIRHAVDHREPVLLITIGNGTHGPNSGSGPAFHSTAPSCASTSG
jgi:hypothetical protein